MDPLIILTFATVCMTLANSFSIIRLRAESAQTRRIMIATSEGLR